jgi:hypothetical protein
MSGQVATTMAVAQIMGRRKGRRIQKQPAASTPMNAACSMVPARSRD